MLTRRKLFKLTTRIGGAAFAMPLWMRLSALSLNAQTVDNYKAIICISLRGGNDGNNMFVPLDPASYNQYAAVRQGLALPQASLSPVQCIDSGAVFGFHPSLSGISSLFSKGYASVIANCGPMDQPLTKQTLAGNPHLLPQEFGSHPISQAQWESATTLPNPSTGWGGLIADQVAGLSGALPALLSVSGVSTFTVGKMSQGVSMLQTLPDGPAFPSNLVTPTFDVANLDSQSFNQLVAGAASVRTSALQSQNLLRQIQQAGSGVQTSFPTSILGQNLKTISQMINGRQVTGSSRQLFYCATGNYDTHGNQLDTHAALLSDLDASITALVAALQEINLLNQVLIVTVSDFGRTMQSNTSGGSDHAWGNHQLLFGGGFQGQRIYGSMPDLDIGGSQDLTGQGIWIPGTSTAQLVGALAKWFGLSSDQISTVVPSLGNFPGGPLVIKAAGPAI